MLGGGVTGLAAGISTGYPVFEADSVPGGICSTYYMTTSGERHDLLPPDTPAYRFERGGGHWIFGGKPETIRFLESLAQMRRYVRRSAVYFSERDLYVPYPIQNHLRYLAEDAEKIVQEMSIEREGRPRTLGAWLDQTFGETLSTLFFRPFHDKYLDGLTDQIEPQDAYKSPVDLAQVRLGASSGAERAGYNATFRYPEPGLGHVVNELRKRSLCECSKEVTAIDVRKKYVEFNDGQSFRYDHLYSTLPLNRVLEMTKLQPVELSDPFTSVLVLNIGAKMGAKCPPYHWLYVPDGRSGFHRVGFYSNVDESFVTSSSEGERRAALSVERAFKQGAHPTAEVVEAYVVKALAELREWEFIEEVEVLDISWIDVAYTWSWVDSSWREAAMKRLADAGIHQIGRYGRWHFQGIADSIGEGLALRR